MYISATAYSKGRTLRIALRKSHKKLTHNITYVIHATGEVSARSVRRGVRGSIVLILGRDLNTWHRTTRSYATKSGKRKLAPVVELHKDFRSLAKHWLICYKDRNKIFRSLRGLLKLDSL